MLDLQKFQNEFLFINFSSSEDALTQLKLILGATKLSDFLANSAHHVYFYPERSWGLGAYNNKALSFLYKAAYTDGSYKYKELNKTELNDKRPNEKCIQYLCEAVFKQLSDENAENEFSKIGGIELLLQILKDEQEFKSLSEQERLAISADFETTDSEELVSKKFKKKYRDNFLNLFKHLKNHYELLKLILSQENSELFEAFGTSLVEWLNKDNLTSVQIYELLNIILNSKNSMLYLKVIPHFQNKLPWEIISSNEINLLLMQSVDKVILSKNTGIFEGQTKPLLEKLPLSNLGAAGAHALLKKLTTEVLRLLKVNGTNRAFALQLFEKTVVPFVNKLPVDELSSQDVYELLFELNQFVLDKKDNEVFEKCVMPLLLKLPLSKLSSEHCFNLLNPLKDKILSNNDLASMGVYAQPLFDRFPVENLTTDDCYKLLEPVMKKVVEQNKQDLFNYTILLVLRRVKIDDPENLGLTTKQCLDLIDHVLKSKYAHHLFASCVIPVLEKLPEDKQESLTNSFIGKDEKTLGSESTVVENKYFALLKPFVEEQNSKHFHRFAGKILNKAVTAKKHKLSAENYSELLKLAIEKGNIEIALTLFGHFDKYPRGAKDRADDLLDYMFSTNCKYDYPIFAELIFNEFPALLTCVDDDGNTWLHLAASRPGQLSRFLLTNKDTVEKINVNQKNRNGETALHIAAKAGNTPMVRKLIASGANVFVQDAQGRTALDLAKEFNQLDVVQIFHSVQGGNIELTSDELDIENLVFRGGGVKGYAYVSALETFDREVKKLSSIRRVAGASAGAITAALVAFNFNIDELKDKLENKNLKDFLDPTSAKDSNLMDEIKALVAEGVNFSSLWTHQKAAFLSRVKSLFDKVYATLDKQQGLQSGDQFREWFIQTIAEKIEKTSLAYGNGVKKEGFDAKAFAESITFEEVESAILVNDSGQAILDDDGLPKKAFKELYVYGTNTATKMPILFSAKHTPNACVVDAVRISMAFPFVFAPWQIYIKENGQRILDPRYKDIKFSDGGIYKNYAPDSFDYDPITGLYRYNPKTVGFNLVSKEDKDFYEQGIISGNVSTDTLFRWLGGIFGSLLGSENFIHAQSQDHDRTIYIEVHVSSMSFDITDKDKLEMSESARAGIHDFKNRRVAMHVPTNLSPETVGNLVRIGILKQTNHKIFALSQYFKSINPKDVLALYAQANEEEIWLLRQLINPHLHQDENGNTAMHIASVYGFEEVLQRFRQLHFDMSMLNKMGHPSDSDEDHVNSCSLDELSETSQISNDEKERILFGENQVLKNKVSKLEEDIRQLQGQLAEAQKSALDDRMSVIQELTRAKDTALAQKEKMIQQLTESKTTELAAKETEIQALTQAKNVALAEKDSEIQALTQARDAALAMKDHEIQALTQARDAALAMKDREIQALTQARDAALTAKDAELQRLRNEKVISSQQQQAISNRILERMDARTQVGIAVSALDALLVIERQEAGKVNFLSIKGRNKPEKVKALEMLIEQLKSNNAPASEIINMVDQLHSGVLRAGVFSHRTSDCLDALISAEYHAENARTFGTFDSFEL